MEQIYCIDNIGFTTKRGDQLGELKELKIGQAYTIDQFFNEQRSLSLKELPGRTFLRSRFISLDEISLAELAKN